MKKRCSHRTRTPIPLQKNLLIVLIPAILFICACAGQGEENKTGWQVANLVTVKEYGKSVDWLASKNLIATARPLYDHYYDVVIFSMDDPDDEIWLTHNAPGAPQKHNGNPAWHPSGEFIVFTAENENVLDDYDDIAKPGRGVNCNLWLARADGSGFWQLTDHETSYIDAKGVIHPQFSPDGNRLFWAERIIDNDETYWGHWVLKIAEFVIDGTEGPHIEDIRTYDPAAQPGFYESHDFSHDGRDIMFTGNLSKGQHETGMDIYIMDTQTENLTRLTASPDEWDEHAHWSPDGEQIVWMSSSGLNVEFPDDMGPLDWRYYLASELWIMDADGSNKQRLTFYNEPDHPHNKAKRTAVSDSAWSPDGKSLIVLVAHYDGTGPSSTGSTELVLVTLEKK